MGSEAYPRNIKGCITFCSGAQVDGFRFDIMGHMMVSTMKAAQAALAALTPARDGVDGSALYLYGEAWDFGEVRPPLRKLSRLLVILTLC